MCTKLLHTGVPSTIIQQLSGHKNVQFVNNYATGSRNQERAMCNILQGNSDSFPKPLSYNENMSRALTATVSSSFMFMVPASQACTAAVSNGANLMALSQLNSTGP